MKLTTHAAVAAGTLAAVAALGVAHSGDSKGPVHVDPATATYTELGPGASQSAVRGDPATGAHGAFTKFVPNFEAGPHTHTNDLRIVVVKGAYVYKPEQGDAIRVTAGQYLLITGRRPAFDGLRREGRDDFLPGGRRQVRPQPRQVAERRSGRNVFLTPVGRLLRAYTW